MWACKDNYFLLVCDVRMPKMMLTRPKTWHAHTSPLWDQDSITFFHTTLPPKKIYQMNPIFRVNTSYVKDGFNFKILGHLIINQVLWILFVKILTQPSGLIRMVGYREGFY